MFIQKVKVSRPTYTTTQRTDSMARTYHPKLGHMLPYNGRDAQDLAPNCASSTGSDVNQVLVRNLQARHRFLPLEAALGILIGPPCLAES